MTTIEAKDPQAGQRIVSIDLSVMDWTWVFLKALAGLALLGLLLGLPTYGMMVAYWAATRPVP